MKNNYPELPSTPLAAPNFINGQWHESPHQHSVESPWTGKDLGSVYYADHDQLNAAVSSAKTAFESWSTTPLKERCGVMFRLREILLAETDAISNVVALECGKTLGEARAGLMKGVEVLEFALSLQNLDQGHKMEVSRGVTCETKREPLGVVASITPFNFPAMVPMWTMPIAITLGNAFIWKPSEKTPLTSKLLGDAFRRAGLPDGVLNIIQGDKDITETMIMHPDVRAISFVGSTPVASSVYTLASSAKKRVLALGGAKNHAILLPDADVDLAASISDSFTGCAGQRCMALSALVAVDNPSKQIEAIVEKAKSTECQTGMGAIITKNQLDFLNKTITKAQEEGAKILLDGRNPKLTRDEFSDGHWIGPTIIDNVAPDSELIKTELFGPVICIIHTKTLKEAVEIQKQSLYGNACSIFTQSGPAAEYMVKHAEAGMLGVNIGVPVPREPFSFGGIKASKFGQGDITGEASLDFWSDLIKVTTKWGKQSDQNWMN